MVAALSALLLGTISHMVPADMDLGSHLGTHLGPLHPPEHPVLAFARREQPARPHPPPPSFLHTPRVPRCDLPCQRAWTEEVTGGHTRGVRGGRRRQVVWSRRLSASERENWLLWGVKRSEVGAWVRPQGPVGGYHVRHGAQEEGRECGRHRNC